MDDPSSGFAFFGYQPEERPTHNVPYLAPNVVKMGNIATVDDITDSFGSMVLNVVESLPPAVQERVANELLPEFHSVIDPKRLPLITSITDEFKTITKKSNLWLTAADENVITQHFIPAVDKTVIFSNLSNVVKHSAFIYQVKSRIGDKETYFKNEGVVKVMNAAIDQAYLKYLNDIMDKVAALFCLLHRSIYDSKITIEKIPSNTTVGSHLTNLREFLRTQILNLEHSADNDGHKKFKQFKRNVFIPKLKALEDDLRNVLNQGPLLHAQSFWAKRMAIQETLYQSIRNSLVRPTHAPLVVIEPGNLMPHSDILLQILLTDVTEELSKGHVTPGNPFNPTVHIYRDNIMICSLLWPLFGQLVTCYNSFVEKSQILYHSLEASIKTSAVCDAFWIQDGQLNPQSLFSANVDYNHKQFDEARLNLSSDGDLLIHQQGNKITISTVPTDNQNEFVTWPLKIDIPSRFEISQILCKTKWLVLVLNIRANAIPATKKAVNRACITAKTMYLYVLSLDRLEHTCALHMCVPIGGVNSVGFSDDSSYLVHNTTDKLHIDNTLYVLMSNMDLYELDLQNKTFMWVTAIATHDETLTKAIASGIRLIHFRDNNYTLLTNNDFIVMGPMESKKIPSTKEQDLNAKAPSLTYIPLMPSKDAAIIDIAEQAHVLAVGLGNGAVMLFDKDEPKRQQLLRPKVVDLDKKGIFTEKGGLVKLVFNSNDELLFYTSGGACLSWKLNVMT